MRGKKINLSVLLLSVLCGCSVSISEIGSNLFNNNLIDINSIDSATVKISTVLTDSLITSNTGRLLVGYHEDPKLGNVSVKTIFQVGVSVPTILDPLNTEYIGLRLYLKRDGYSFYDTTSTQTISVFQLTKQLQLINGLLFNSSKFSIDKNNPIGTLTFQPRPHHPDSLEIALPDAMGQELMTLVQEKDLQVTTNENFLRYFKGLVLVPDSSSSRNMIGFSTKTELRLYYRDLGVVPTKEKWVSFGIGPNNTFNYFYSDRSGTSLSPIVKYHDTVSSEVTHQEAYFQSGIGLAIRLEMPHLRDFLIKDRKFLVSRATLQLVPVLESTKPDPLPTVLYLYRVDELNRLISNVPLGGRLLTDVELGRNTHYEADITSFVNSQIQTDAANKNALLILLDDKQNRSTINRLYVGDKKNQYSMKIKLYSITLSNQ